MAKHLYLPQLADTSNVQEPAHAAHWHSYQRGIMLQISEGILVDEQAKTKGVSSIPDPWARPLLFQAALKANSKHPLREQLVQEWQGLLSLLALQRVHGHHVDVVVVPPLEPGRMRRALFDLAPQPIRLERGAAYAWTDMVLIRYEGVAVGAFSPGTLVYTGTSYARLLRGRAFNLIDPVGFLRPPQRKEDLRYVGEWITRLQERLNAPEDPIFDTSEESRRESSAVADINRLLGEFLASIRQKCGLRDDSVVATQGATIDDPVETQPPNRIPEQYRVYRELLRPLKVQGSENRSELTLTTDEDRNNSGFNEAVVITAGLLQTDARIWDVTRLSGLGGDATKALDSLFSAASGTRIGSIELSPHAFWFRPEKYLLSDTLIRPQEGTTFIAEDEESLNGGRDFVLPFRKEILQFFSPRSIREKLRPEFKRTETGVIFSFVLPVGGRLERIEKTYRFKSAALGEGMICTIPVPSIDVFPNYLDENWRRYYLFNDSEESVSVLPIASPKVKTETRVHEIPGGRRVRITELSGDGAFPEAVELHGTGDSNSVYGLILISRSAEPAGLSGDWRIGIDFGTSNTNVFRMQSDMERAEPWSFEFGQHMRRLTDAPSEVRGKLLESFFLPDRTVALPVPTALRVYQDAVKDYPLLDYFINFSQEYDLPANVHTNIKWDEQQPKTGYFLECLLILLLAEAVKRRVNYVELAFSYPRAFSENTRYMYENTVGSTLEKLLKGGRRVLSEGSAAELGRMRLAEPQFQVEGIAAGEFFASEKTIRDPRRMANIGSGTICLDVGGRTTDISIWYQNDIVFDASILLAGKEVADVLRERPHLLGLLFTQEAARALEAKIKEPAAFAARLNLVLHQEENRIHQMLIQNTNQREIQWLRRMLALEFGAIAFYTGALLGAADTMRNGILDNVVQRGIALHWGGNAAKLITWLDFGKYSENGLAAKMLNGILYNAIHDLAVKPNAATLAQHQSPWHKSEAAGGLVVMRDRVQGRSAVMSEDDFLVRDTTSVDTSDGGQEGDEGGVHAGGVVCGENIRLANREVKYTELVSETTLFPKNGTSFQGTSLERLKRFVQVLNTFATRFGLYGESDKVNLEKYERVIMDRVDNHFITEQSVRHGERVLEPVFISEVKLLMKVLQNESR